MYFSQLKIRPRHIVLFCLAIGFALSLSIILAWILDIKSIIIFGPEYIVTKFNTGIGYLLSAIAFYLLEIKKRKTATLVISIFVLLLSGLTISEHIFHWNAGIDELLVKDYLTAPGNHPGRMTFGSALHLLLLSVILISIRYKKEHIINDILVIPLWASSFLVLIGYVFQSSQKQPFPGYSLVSPIAVITMFMISSAVFFNSSQYGVIAPFTKQTTAARVNRRILLISIVVTFLFAWLRMQGELHGLYLHNFGTVLMALFFILILVFTTRFSTITLNKAEEEIKKQKELSESILESLPGVFFLFNENEKLLRVNKQMTQLTGCLNTEVQKNIKDFFPVDQQQKMLAYFNEVSEKGMSTIEADILDKTGNPIPYFFKAVPIEYEGKDCIVGTGVDISERKAAEHEVQLVNMQLRQLTKHMDHLRENERIHIAREIHDELGQQLTVLKMNIAWLQSNNTVNDEEHNQRISNMLSLSENTINTIRKIAYNLRPQIIEDLGIAEALKLYSKEFQNQTGISVHFFTEIENLDLSFDTSTALYRIYQESLTNVARYAEASVVNASLDLNERELVLSVSDNGKGFNVADLKKRKSLGVIGMRERAGMIGGHFSIHSEPGEGTHVQVSVDLENDL